MVVNAPLEIVACDLVGPLNTSSNGYKHIAVFTDHFTRFAIATPVFNVTTQEIIRVLISDVISKFGLPKKFLTDNGTGFMSNLGIELYKYFGMKKLTTTPYHPETDGLTERFNKTLCDMLSSYVNESGDDWDIWLPLVTSAYNSTSQESTLETPFFLMFGRDPGNPLSHAIGSDQFLANATEDTDTWKLSIVRCLNAAREIARDNSRLAHEVQKRQYDKLHSDTQFKVLDSVWLYVPMPPTTVNRKFYRSWHGPYRIIEKISPVNYRLIDRFGVPLKSLVHVQRLKKAFSWTNRPSEKILLVPDDLDDSILIDNLIKEADDLEWSILDDEAALDQDHSDKQYVNNTDVTPPLPSPISSNSQQTQTTVKFDESIPYSMKVFYQTFLELDLDLKRKQDADITLSCWKLSLVNLVDQGVITNTSRQKQFRKDIKALNSVKSLRDYLNTLANDFVNIFDHEIQKARGNRSIS